MQFDYHSLCARVKTLQEPFQFRACLCWETMLFFYKMKKSFSFPSFLSNFNEILIVYVVQLVEINLYFWYAVI